MPEDSTYSWDLDGFKQFCVDRRPLKPPFHLVKREYYHRSVYFMEIRCLTADDNKVLDYFFSEYDYNNKVFKPYDRKGEGLNLDRNYFNRFIRDLFIPDILSFVDRYEISSEEFNPRRDYPLPGDLVKIIKSHDTLIKDGSYGVIEGLINQETAEYLVCFNAYSAFRDSVLVSCSGGPARTVQARSMKPSDEKKSRTFWHWKDGYAHADNADQYSVNCRVWDYYGRS